MTIQLKCNKVIQFIPFTKYYSDYKFTFIMDTLYVKEMEHV
jgi:hypothetical protein